MATWSWRQATILSFPAQSTGSKLDWVQCGLCVDERGMGECIPGPRRGSPADLVKFSEASAATLVIPVK